MRRLAYYTAILFLANNFIYAQSIYFGLGGGYTSITGQSYNNAVVYQDFISPWSIDITEVNNQKNYEGFSVAGFFKLKIINLPINFISGISYAQLSSSADNVKYHSPPWYSTIYSGSQLESISNLISVSTGAQWELFRYRMITPFISFNLLYNFFDKTRLKLKDDYSTFDAIIEGKNRLGLSFKGGINLSLISFIDIDMDAGYSFNNLMGKETDEKNLNSFNSSLILYFKIL